MRESLSRAAVVDAARELLMNEGLSGLSLRRLAARLDAAIDPAGKVLLVVLLAPQIGPQLLAEIPHGLAHTVVCAARGRDTLTSELLKGSYRVEGH